MSTPPGSTPPPGPPPGAPPDRELTDDELRAAYEAELQRIRVEDVLVQAVVSLLNLGARKAGLAGPDAEADRDLEQVRQAIEGVRALLPLVEPALGADAKAVRDALSQLQLAYARAGGGGGATPAGGEGESPERPEPKPDVTGPPPSSGRLWVPGQ